MMIKSTKKLVACFVAFIMIFGIIPFSVIAIDYSGNCGENLVWHLNTTTGNLTISGTGEMTDTALPPWHNLGSYIKSLTIEEGVKSIGDYAFLGLLENLTEIVIPDSVERIGDFAFTGATNVTELRIGSGVKSIGEQAFVGFDSIEKVFIPDSVETIADFAFFANSKLKNLTLGKNLKSIGNFAFSQTAIEKVEIPYGVMSVGLSAFQYCTNLKSVFVSDTVTEICKDAFNNCTSLESLTLGSSLKKLGEFSFLNCNLENLFIPQNVSYIGERAFYCKGLKNITVDKNNTNYSNDENGVLFDKEKTCLIQYPAGNTADEYIVPDTVTKIASNAFAYADINNLIIGDNLSLLKDNVFLWNNLHSITVDEKNEFFSSDEGVLFDKEKTTLILYPSKKDEKSYRIPFSVTAIEKNAFYMNSDTKNVIISNNVKSIGDSAFNNGLRIFHFIGEEEEWFSLINQTNSFSYKDVHYCVIVPDSEATCVADGYKDAIFCEICGIVSGTKISLESANHTFLKYVSNNDATCTKDGTKTSVCEYCGSTDTIIDKGSSLGKHTFTEYISNNDATCIRNGTKTAVCDYCDATDTISVEGTAGHKYDSGKITLTATCKEYGVKTFTCVVCGDVYTQNVEKTEHTEEEMQEKKPTCTEFGLTRGVKCSVCDVVLLAQVKINPTGHCFTVYKSDNNATCTENGTKTAVCDFCDETDKITEEGTSGHKYDSGVITTPATCKDRGIKTFTCTVCGDSYTKYIAKSFHTRVIVEGKKATCVEPGLTQGVKCSYCDEILTPQEKIEATGHKFAEYISDNNATCTEDGTKTAVCNYCGITDTIIDEGTSGHDYNMGETTKFPTCIDKGIETFTCVVCGDTYIREIATTDHFGRILPEVAPTCVAPGLTMGVQCGTCGITILAQKEISATGHSFTKYISDKNATCTEDGTKTAKCDNCDATNTLVDIGSSSTAHSFTKYVSDDNATCTQDGTKTAECDYCGISDTITDVGSAKHAFDEGVYIKVPTCKEKGLIGLTCKVCGEYQEKEIPYLRHNFKGEYILIKHPTCIEPAYFEVQCVNEGCYETIIIERSDMFGDHKFEIIHEVEATCIEDGYKVYRCKVCGYEETETVEASHSMGEWYVYRRATCTVNGEMRITCADCDYYNCEIIQKLDHMFSDYTSDNNANCTSDGTKTAVCNRNGCFAVDTVPDVGSKKDHSYGEWYQQTRSDCTNNGYNRRDCLNCNHFEMEETPALGHFMGDCIEIYPADCMKPGLMYKLCELCNYAEYEEIDRKVHADKDSDGYCDICDLKIETEKCCCNCHKDGLIGFIWNFVSFIKKIFKSQQYCECGTLHW